MRALYHTSRWIFGLWYLFSGVEYFTPFELQPLGNTPLGQEFTLALIHSGLFAWIKVAEIAIAVLVLADRMMPLVAAAAVPLTVVIAYWNFALEWGVVEVVFGALTILFNAVLLWPYRAYYRPTLTAWRGERDFSLSLD
ncbi:hypothetical protein [Novosphingobium decolorationis]|uniref:DoxX family protein n=1 Tax=Novosphingobium decolorationis TaxID=2698673 RepID=A0ABX8E353_9SPHN|nr:hypothetical protein [Novosphingobium decolorationis]MED5545120.1 hypothetical protein [Pseudomonadota bacterium]QVM83580.1 hypothetical protein HT578_07635 [Novosphingobium decolorationis]